MMKSLATIVLLATAALAVVHRPIKIVAYPYIPDLNGDQLQGLAEFLQERFLQDTGRQIQILFDLTDYATDTYSPNLVVDALSTGGYDMQEIDTLILGYLRNHDAILPIPSGVSFDGFGPEVVKAVKDGSVKYGHPSYTCTNIYYTFDNSIKSTDDGDEFVAWMNAKRGSRLGWTGDLSQGLSLRLEYLDGWKDSHPTTPFYPAGYDPDITDLDNHVVSNIIALRNSCAKDHVNHCMDSEFYFNAHGWFTQFVNDESLVLQGFPEYTSEILEIKEDSSSSPNFHKKLRVAPALVGQGDRPYLFTDAWVISKANCDADCQSTAKIFLNWQRLNWAQLITLGADLTPQRPRYLAIAYQPFYNSDDLSALAHQAQDYYLFFNQEINRAVSQDTMKFWDNEDSQSASLQQLVSVGYTP